MGLHRVSDYVKLHRQMGENFKWFKAIKVPSGTTGATSDGFKIIEQTIPANVKVLVANTTDDFTSEEFGPIPAGTLQVSAIPAWGDLVLRFNRNDRFIPLGIGRVHSGYSSLRRAASGTEDALKFTPVQSITSVYIAGVLQTATHYEATETGINWLSGIPSAGTEYVVEYVYYPRYLVLPQNHRTSPTDRTGKSLPLHYWLQLESNTGDQNY